MATGMCYSFSSRRRFVLFVLVASSFRATRFRPVVVLCYSFSSRRRFVLFVVAMIAAGAQCKEAECLQVLYLYGCMKIEHVLERIMQAMCEISSEAG